MTNQSEACMKKGNKILDLLSENNLLETKKLFDLSSTEIRILDWLVKNDYLDIHRSDMISEKLYQNTTVINSVKKLSRKGFIERIDSDWGDSRRGVKLNECLGENVTFATPDKKLLKICKRKINTVGEEGVEDLRERQIWFDVKSELFMVQTHAKTSDKDLLKKYGVRMVGKACFITCKTLNELASVARKVVSAFANLDGGMSSIDFILITKTECSPEKHHVRESSQYGGFRIEATPIRFFGSAVYTFVVGEEFELINMFDTNFEAMVKAAYAIDKDLTNSKVLKDLLKKQNRFIVKYSKEKWQNIIDMNESISKSADEAFSKLEVEIEKTSNALTWIDSKKVN